jgi:hypothetical protein
VRLADVRPEAVQWLWPGRLAAGKLTILAGDPGLGKSWITHDVAARASSGRPWPDGAAGLAPINVLMLSAEDGLADTIRPRLDALGADVARVHHLAVLRAGEKERAVQLADTGPIEQAITQTGARILSIDPMSAYLGTTDSHRDAEVRGLLAPLAALAERTGVAIVGVMHLTKGAQRPAIYRAAGSIAFTAAARIVLAVAAGPHRPERRIVAPVKSNLSAPPAALAYTLADGRLVWESEPVTDVDIDRLLDGPPVGRDREEQTEAEQLIHELLEDVSAWPMTAGDARKAADARGINWRTMQRSAKRMGVGMGTRRGFGRAGCWLWQRPIGDTLDAKTRQSGTLSPMSPMGDQAAIDDTTTIEDTKSSHRARARSRQDADDDTGQF